jgi:hypothetical protein
MLSLRIHAARVYRTALPRTLQSDA